MSVIVGVVRLDGRKASTTEAERLLSVMRTGSTTCVRVSSHAAFGYRSAERQRSCHVRSSDRGLWVGTARLDNASELADHAGSPGNTADAELLFTAQQALGDRTFEIASGDFASALWSEDERRLTLSRDIIGIVPLYYRAVPGRLAVFASDLRTVLSATGDTRTADGHMIARYMMGSYPREKVRTFFTHVQRVPAGCTVSIDSEAHVRTHGPHWQPETVGSPGSASDAELEEMLRDLLTRAVRCRMSDLPGGTGASLSGGLDSSTVTAIARLLDARRPLRTFSLYTSDLPAECAHVADERAWVNRVVAAGGFVAAHLDLSAGSPLQHADEQITVLGQPYENSYVTPTWLIHGAAARAGVPVLLTGTDGDTAVSHGTEWLDYLITTGRFREFSRAAAALSARQQLDVTRYVAGSVYPRLPHLLARGRVLRVCGAALHLRHTYGVPMRRTLWQYALRPLVAPPHASALRDRAGSAVYLNRRFAALVRELGSEEARHERARGTNPQLAHAARLRDGSWQTVAEYEDVIGRHFGVETRFPFFDRRVLEFCIGLPMRAKVRDGWTRYILRSATSGVVPDAIRWRVTKGSLLPWFQRRLWPADRERLERLLHRSAYGLAEIFDIRSVRSALGFYARSPANCVRFADVLQRAAIIDAWLRHADVSGVTI